MTAKTFGDEILGRLDMDKYKKPVTIAKHTPKVTLLCSEEVFEKFTGLKAEYALRAINSHEDLMEAGEAFLKYAKSNYSGDGMTALELMEKAIAKAEVK